MKNLESLKYINFEKRINIDQFIIETQNAKFRKEIKQDFHTDENGTISLDEAIELLQKYKSSISDNIVDLLLNEKITNKQKYLYQNTFFYESKYFEYVVCDDIVYLKGLDVAKYFDYDYGEKILIKDVHRYNKILYEDLIESINDEKKNNISYSEKKTIYIAEPGLLELTQIIKNKKIRKFYNYVINSIVPELYSYITSYHFTFAKNNNSFLIDKNELLLIDKFPTKQQNEIIDTKEFIDTKENINNFSIGFEQEKTKQMEIELKMNEEKTKQMEIELKMNGEKTKQMEIELKILELQKYKKNINYETNLNIENDDNIETKLNEEIIHEDNTEIINDSDEEHDEKINDIKNEIKKEIEKDIINEIKCEVEELKENVDKVVKETKKINKKDSSKNKDYKKILKKYFEFTDNDKDIIYNSQIEEYANALGIKRSKIREYLIELGSTKYKCNSTYGHRKIIIKKKIPKKK